MGRLHAAAFVESLRIDFLLKSGVCVCVCVCVSSFCFVFWGDGEVAAAAFVGSLQIDALLKSRFLLFFYLCRLIDTNLSTLFAVHLYWNQSQGVSKTGPSHIRVYKHKAAKQNCFSGALSLYQSPSASALLWYRCVSGQSARGLSAGYLCSIRCL